MSVRSIPRNYLVVTGIVSTKKSIGDAGFEGTLEPDLYRTLAFDPAVARFEVQPVRIEWRDASGRLRHYTPDCRIHYSDPNAKPLLVEVKSRASLRKHWKELRPAFRAAVRFASSEGSRFKILTEKEIRTEYLFNVRFLLPIVRRGVQGELRTQVLRAMCELEETTPAKLLSAITADQFERARLLPAVWYLIGTHQIWVDLSKPLAMDSPVRYVRVA